MSTAWSSVSRHTWCRKHTSARSRHLTHPVGRGGPHAVEQDPLIVAVDPAHVDVQHGGRLDQCQPRQKPLHATDRRVRRAGLDAVHGRVRLVVVAGDQRIKPVAHRRRQTLRARTGQQRGGSLEPPRRVFEEPRQPFTGGGIERAQTPVLADALLMFGDRLLPAGATLGRIETEATRSYEV